MNDLFEQELKQLKLIENFKQQQQEKKQQYISLLPIDLQKDNKLLTKDQIIEKKRLLNNIR